MRTTAKRRQRIAEVPTSKLRGTTIDNTHIAPREPRRIVKERAPPPVQNPPQAELLADEYVHNLQQQKYFLEAELRFLRDRAGADDSSNGPSVDAAIRRLRRACAMHEEETNKKILQMEQQIEQKDGEFEEIDQSDAMEKLSDANNREHEGIDRLKAGFVEIASKVHMRQLEKSHYDNAAEFNDSMRESMSNALSERRAKREALEQELRNERGRIEDVRSTRKDLMAKFDKSIRNKRMHEEEADWLSVIGKEEEPPPPNLPASTIRARNAKVEKDLEAAKENRYELEQQLEQLLEKNVKLKAELNDIRARVERGRRLKDEMDKQFAAKYGHIGNENKKLANDLANLKAERKKAKDRLMQCTDELAQSTAEINRYQGEEDLLSQATAFKSNERQKLEVENDKTRAEITAITSEVRDMRTELDELSSLLAEASEEMRRVETLVNINKEDPRCTMENIPNELAQLLDSLQEVNKQLE